MALGREQRSPESSRSPVSFLQALRRCSALEVSHVLFKVQTVVSLTSIAVQAHRWELELRKCVLAGHLRSVRLLATSNCMAPLRLCTLDRWLLPSSRTK